MGSLAKGIVAEICVAAGDHRHISWGSRMIMSKVRSRRWWRFGSVLSNQDPSAIFIGGADHAGSPTTIRQNDRHSTKRRPLVEKVGRYWWVRPRKAGAVGLRAIGCFQLSGRQAASCWRSVVPGSEWVMMGWLALLDSGSYANAGIRNERLRDAISRMRPRRHIAGSMEGCRWIAEEDPAGRERAAGTRA